nr:hypothetical protein [Nanoarchaeum sp.]
MDETQIQGIQRREFSDLASASLPNWGIKEERGFCSKDFYLNNYVISDKGLEFKMANNLLWTFFGVQSKNSFSTRLLYPFSSLLGKKLAIASNTDIGYPAIIDYEQEYISGESRKRLGVECYNMIHIAYLMRFFDYFKKFNASDINKASHTASMLPFGEELANIARSLGLELIVNDESYSLPPDKMFPSIKIAEDKITGKTSLRFGLAESGLPTLTIPDQDHYIPTTDSQDNRVRVLDLDERAMRDANKGREFIILPPNNFDVLTSAVYLSKVVSPSIEYLKKIWK